MSFSGEKPSQGAVEAPPLSAQEALRQAREAVEVANAEHAAFFKAALEGGALNDDQKTLLRELMQDIGVERLDMVVYTDPATGKGHLFREYFTEELLQGAEQVIRGAMKAHREYAEAQKRVEAEQQEAKRAQEKVQIEVGHVMSFPGGWRQIQDEANRYQAEADAHVTALRERMDRPMPTLADLLKASPKEQQEGPLPGSGQDVGRWDKKDLPPFQGGVQERRVDDPAAVVGPEVQTMIMPEPPRPPSLGDRFKSLAKKLFG
jgi:hypothetical protein